MKIAMVAPLYEAVPPRFYGGTERIVAHLADALVELDQDVTLFSSEDSTTKAQLVAVRDQAIRLDPCMLKSDLAAHMTMLDEVRRRLNDFDVFHFHTDFLHFPFFEAIAARTLTTLHGRLDLKDLGQAFARWPQYPLVSISDHQRLPQPNLSWIGTVYHGLCEHLYQYCARPRGDYLAFLGRISPEKRLDRAIAIATRAGIPLRVAAKVDAVDRTYFQEVIAPMLNNPLVEFLGEIGDDEKSEFLGNARALLFPIDWPEPFGLVMIEAMACGTPVIAWNKASVPEVIDDGMTGIIVNSEDEAVAALRAIEALDRKQVRRVFEQRFSAITMARHYLELYHSLIESAAPKSAASATGFRLKT